MSVYRVHLSDGRAVTVEADHEPNEQEILGQLNTPDEPAADFSDVSGGSSTADRSTGDPGLRGIVEGVKGIGKTLASDTIGLGEMGLKGIRATGLEGPGSWGESLDRATGLLAPGSDVNDAINTADAARKDLEPQSNAEKAGKFVGQAAEFMVPGAKAASAMKASSWYARALANGGLSGLTAGAQSGGDPGDTAVGAATGAAGEVAGTALPHLLEKSGIKNWLKILNKTGLNPYQKQALRESLGTVSNDLPAGTMDSLAGKTAAAVEESGKEVGRVYKTIENDPVSLAKPVSNLKASVDKPVTQGGRTIQPGRPDVRFNDLSPTGQEHHLNQITQAVAPGVTWQQLPPSIQAQIRAQASAVNDVVYPGVKEILDSPTAGAAMREVTGRVKDVADIPNLTVGQTRGLRQGLGEDASKALESGIITPKGEALKAAGGEVTNALHTQYPQTVKPDSQYSAWRKIGDQMKNSLEADPDKLSAFAKYYVAKLGLSFGAGTVFGEVTGEGHGKSLALGVGATAAMAAANTGLWNSLSASTKFKLANLIEAGDNAGALRALKAASIMYVSKIRRNNQLAREEQAKQSQRTGVMVE